MQLDQLPLIMDEELDNDEPMSFPGYHLEMSDIDSFLKFWSICTQTCWHRSLILAGNRLLQTQTREGDSIREDRLIDLMIACEALVLDGENVKGDNIARRVGKLQKQKMPHLEKEAIDNLKLAYRLRNDAVHDGEFSPERLAKEVPFADRFLMYIEQFLRIGMTNYIELMNQGQSKKQIIQYLDGPQI